MPVPAGPGRGRRSRGLRDRDATAPRSRATLVYPPSNRLLGWTAATDDSELRLSPGVIASALAVSALLTPYGAVDAGADRDGRWWRWMRRSAATAGPIRCCATCCRRTAGCACRRGSGPSCCCACRCWRRSAAPTWPGTSGHARYAAPLALALLLVHGRRVRQRDRGARRCRARRRRSTTGWRRCRRRSSCTRRCRSQTALPGVDVDFQFFAQHHRHRLLNGNSGFYPPDYVRDARTGARLPRRRCHPRAARRRRRLPAGARAALRRRPRRSPTPC